MKKVPDVPKEEGAPTKNAKQAPASKPDTRAQSAAKAGRVALAAAMLGMPAVMVPQQAAAQSTVGPPISPTKPAVPSVSLNFAKVETEYRPIKMAGTYTVMGASDGHTIFKSADGSMFYLDPMTGDKRSVAVDLFIKIGDIKGEKGSTASQRGASSGGAGKVSVQDISMTSIVGLDAKGNAVMRNARNETFTLDPRTGDRVLIKSAK